MKADVFFAPVKAGESLASIGRKTIRLLEKSGLKKIVRKNHLVAVKQHFGEDAKGHFIKPEITGQVVKSLRELGAKPFVTDTNTLYRGGRSEAQSHLETAYNHGFTYEKVGAPVIIADGLRGLEEVAVPIEGRLFQQVRIAGAVYHADAAVILTHVTGHLLAGYGGAIKNVGMGLASRHGKLLQHSETTPKQNVDKCTACGACVKWCPADAIALTKTARRAYAKIDKVKCTGCGECIAVCQTGAMTFDWSSSGPIVMERMVEHALGFVTAKADRALYVNFAIEITKNCDCGRAETPRLDAVGLFASTDLLACEQATVDLVNQTAGTDFFAALWPELRYQAQLDYAEKLGLGTRDYQLIRL